MVFCAAFNALPLPPLPFWFGGASLYLLRRAEVFLVFLVFFLVFHFRALLGPYGFLQGCSTFSHCVIVFSQFFHSVLPSATMSNRLTRSEKEKWVAGTYRSSRRRSPVRIPQCDTSALIEENKFTLIGRVTNPAVQKPKAVAYMPQLWHLDNRVVGRDLGSECFQFRFESEADLQAVLKRGPYHFKNWMLIRQQWEPIVSNSFPAFITFWVKIHGIPLHFWSDQTIRTIGKELGALSARDVSEGRIRVPVNGLGSLEMSMPIRVPDGAVKTVELEYEKLEKHCFNCFELSHEKKDCHHPLVSKPLGINQLKVIQRMESERRRQEERRDERPQARPLPEGSRGSRETRNGRDVSQFSSGHISARDPRRPAHTHALQPSRSSSRSGIPERVRYRSRSPYSRHYSVSRDPYIDGHSRDSHRVNGAASSAGIRAHSPRGRESSRSNSRRSPTRLSPSHRSPPRRSISVRSRYSRTPPPCPPRQPLVVSGVMEVGEGSSIPHSRRPALERISPRIQVNTSNISASRTDSGRLQDVEIQYAGNNDQALLGDVQIMPLAAGENRVHTSLRLGPIPAVPQSKAKGSSKKKSSAAAASKTTVNRKIAKASPRRRVARSPLQGISLRKRNVSRTNISSKKKLCVDQPEQEVPLPVNQDPISQDQVMVPPVKLIPATSKGVGDFRSPSNLLP